MKRTVSIFPSFLFGNRTRDPLNSQQRKKLDFMRKFLIGVLTSGTDAKSFCRQISVHDSLCVLYHALLLEDRLEAPF